MERRAFLKRAGEGMAATALAAPAIAQTGAPVRWRLAASWPKSLDAMFGAVEAMCQRVAQLTDKKFEIQPFAGGEIVPALQVLDATQNGTIDCCHTLTAFYVGKNPAYAFDSGVAFGLNNRQQNAWMYYGGGLELMRDLFQKSGLRPTPCGNVGVQMGGFYRKEINSVEDLKGLKFRIGGLGGTILAKLGVVPQQIATADIYPSLERGTIDAAEWIGPYDDEKLGLHKVAKYYYFPGWWEGSAQVTLIVNLKQWEALPDLYKAAGDALTSIDSRLRWTGIAANLFQGISLGSVLLLAAIGLAITFGVMGVINMAHGEMIMTGAYVAFVVQQLFRAFLPPGLLDAYLLVAVPVAFLFAGLLGVLLERCLIRFLYGRPLETLLATWGVSLILQQAVRSMFGSPNKEVANPSWMTGGFDVLGGFMVTWNRLYIIVFCFVVLGALALILNRTRFGLHMRAVTQNRDMAAAMGIPTARVDALTFGLGSGIAGMAGVALSQIGNVSPNLGTLYIVDSFMVVVFGGVGNLMGTLVGALSLGIVNKLLEPYAGAILGKIVVLVAIILFIQRRPRGLFALKGRTADAEA